MKNVLIIVLLCPLISFPQSNLQGLWRLKESKNIKGPDYTNAIPIMIQVEQKEDITVFRSTFNDGQKDTIINESLIPIETGLNKDITVSGKRRIASFKKIKNDWVKETEIFTKEDSNKRQSLNKETFTLSDNGDILLFVRDYDGNDDPNGNQDYIISGTYEKITPEQLTKESAIGNGVMFTHGLTWKQIKTKARKEHKYIFVDCYATWCRPCKTMDKTVYPLNIVGDAMNSYFISIKVQMDSSKNDPGAIKMMYPVARMMEKDYNINGLPTYLFFSPEGRAIHKVVGQRNAKDFIDLVYKVRQPKNQLYTLVEKAKRGEIPWNDYPILVARLKKEFEENDLAGEVAKIYYQQYLKKLKQNELLTKFNLDFIGQYRSLVNSADKLFQICLREPSLVDSIKQYPGGGWARMIVHNTIVRENVDPLMQKAEKLKKDPDWTLLENQLTINYNNKLATNYVLEAKVNWYKKIEDWKSFFKYLKPYLALKGLKNVDGEHLHWYAWDVFKYSSDTSLLKDALNWIDFLIDETPKELLWTTMDTKACLLYKFGKRAEGINTMKKIIELFPDFKTSFQERLNHMLNNENIWLTFN